MRAQIRGLDQASRNTQDGQALIQTAEGGMNEITNMLQRVRELMVQASNDTNADTNREAIQMEVDALRDGISALAGRVQFNGMHLLSNNGTLDGTVSGGTTGEFHFQIGANSDQMMTVDLNAAADAIMDAWTFVNGVDIENGAANAISGQIDGIDDVLNDINLQRGQLGAWQNRMDYTMRSLDISSENLSDAESRVRNADMAREMMRFTMANVLQQASVSMLAQANQLPNNLLQLLR